MPSWLAIVRTGGRRRPGASWPQTMPYSMTPRSWVPRGTGRAGSTLKGMKLAETVFLQTITQLVALQADLAGQRESHAGKHGSLRGRSKVDTRPHLWRHSGL